jgi:hypothetical protein
MNNDQRTQVLQELADTLSRRRLLVPARMLLDVVAPLGVMASQVALFAQPFLPHSRWRAYVAALDDEYGWKVLHHMVDQRDS